MMRFIVMRMISEVLYLKSAKRTMSRPQQHRAFHPTLQSGIVTKIQARSATAILACVDELFEGKVIAWLGTSPRRMRFQAYSWRSVSPD